MGVKEGCVYVRYLRRVSIEKMLREKLFCCVCFRWGSVIVVVINAWSESDGVFMVCVGVWCVCVNSIQSP